MLVSKTQHKGIFIKELFIGKFILSEDSQNVSKCKQLLAVTESSLEIFDYFYDKILNNHIIEPKLRQELFFHILDAEIITPENYNMSDTQMILLLTTCGLLVLKYSQDNKIFLPYCSEVLNINCEVRDRLMYIKTDDAYAYHFYM